MQSFLIFLTYYNLFVKHESKSSNSLRWVWHQTVLVFKLYSTEILEEHRWTREPSILWQIRRTNNRIAFFPFCQCGWNRRQRDVINAGSSSSVWQIFQPKPILFFVFFPDVAGTVKANECCSSGSYSLWLPLSVNMMRQVWISQMERLPHTSMQLSCLTVPCLVCCTTTEVS